MNTKKLNDEFEALWKEAQILVDRVSEKDDKLAQEVSSMFDEFNYNRYQLGDEADRQSEIVEEYENIMEATFTIVKMARARSPEPHGWCIDNLKSDWHYLEDGRVAFADKEEAMLYKLTWGGKT